MRPAPRLPAALLAALLPLAAPAARADAGDSLRVRFEIGLSGEVTNERYYETFDDSTFRREPVDDPERRYGGVALLRLDGARHGGSTWFQVTNELLAGDRLTRNVLGALWRSDLTPEDRLSVDPRLEYRRDRTLGRDLDEWRATVAARFRHQFLESFRSLDVALRGELLRADGAGAQYLLDRQAGGVAAGFEQIGITGPEWRLGYRFTARRFPDSTARDHYEHGWEGRLRSDPASSWSWQVETSGERRVTIALAPTSRDNFWQERVDLEVERRGEGVVGLRARLEGEALQYDLPDSSLYFDYRTARLAAGPRFGGDRGWALWAAPRVEALFAPWNPGEEYVEGAVQLELESFAGRAWWSVTPAAGWRSYRDDPVAAALGLEDLRSSYAFAELAAHGDQPLPGALRLRLNANARLEAHADESQDAASLYFSLDVRKIF